MSAKWMLFSDESGMTPEYKCYGIGLLAIREEQLPKLNEWFEDCRSRHGVWTEVKWKRIDNKSHGRMNLALALLEAVMRSSARLEIMVVHKGYYQLWKTASREVAFYKTFTQLLNHTLKGAEGDYEVLMDERSDRYAKHDEVLTRITNRMQGKAKGRGRLVEVNQGDSKLTPGIQIADLLCGAVTTACNLYLHPTMKLKAGKVVLIKRMAEVLGWDHLWYDTYDNHQLNIWHFPTEWTGVPASRRVPNGPRTPKYVTPEGLEKLCGSRK